MTAIFSGVRCKRLHKVKVFLSRYLCVSQM